MAAVALAADPANLLPNLSMDPQTKACDTTEASKVNRKTSVAQSSVSCVSEEPNISIPSREPSITPVLQEINNSSPFNNPSPFMTTSFYYGGYDPTMEWDDYTRYMSHECMDMSHGLYGGEFYHHGYGYAPYGAYPSNGTGVPSMGHDGQLYGQQQYHYPTPFYQSPTPPPSYAPNQLPTSQGPSLPSKDQQSLSSDLAKMNLNGNANGNSNGSSGSVPLRTNNQNTSLAANGSYNRGVFAGGFPSSGYQDPRFPYDGMPLWFDMPTYSNGHQHRSTAPNSMSTLSQNRNATVRNQAHSTLPILASHTPSRLSSNVATSGGLTNRMYPSNRVFGQYGGTLRTGLNYPSNYYDSRTNNRWPFVVDSKYKSRTRVNALYGFNNENMDGLTELNRGPRSGCLKNQKVFAQTVLAVKGQALPTDAKDDSCCVVPDKDQYNLSDFPESYTDAKFFVIKSYSEDDVHKSVKYNVWASTPNGNKKLDAAYQEAKGKTGGCPIFLFFSVNTSGQFIGVAEMVGPVDFDKTVDYWQQDKWTGCFPVKWHIVKDVPNNILKHITLENNDNKSVTKSRDTQEVELQQGLQMIKLFKEHAYKTFILEDFPFYENRQKIMQERRLKQQQYNKQVLDGRSADNGADTDKDALDGKTKFSKPLEPISILTKDCSVSCLLDKKPSEESGISTKDDDASTVLKAALENHFSTAVTTSPI